MRSWILVSLALSAFALPAFGQTDPNLLVLVADDLGVDMVPVYGEGNDLPVTPNIDSLASGGLLFRNAWANPNCSPTRAALLTGRYGFRTGIGDAIDHRTEALPEEEVTLPELLDLAGSPYATAAFGKWHLGNETNGGRFSPNIAGFDHYDGCLLGDLNQPLFNANGYYDWPRVVNGVRSQSTTYATTATTDAAIGWIQSQGTTPWLAVVNYNAPHLPLHTPPAGLYSEDLSGLDPVTTPRPFYKAMAEAMDAEIGRLLREIAPRLTNTIIVFLGDNGTPQSLSVPPFTNSHGKATVYEGGVNVPLILKGPGVSAGECGALVNVSDLFVTLAQLAGVVPEVWMPGVHLDSISIGPYLSDPTRASIRSFVYAERFLPIGAIGYVPTGLRAIRDERYKFLVLPGGFEFYDLEVDPFETTNLLFGPLLPQEAQRLDGLIVQLIALLTSV